MPFEVYAPARKRGVPKVSISERGRIRFNRHAAREVARRLGIQPSPQKQNQKVVLAYDGDIQTLLVVPAEAAGGGKAFTLQFTTTGASIPAKAAMRHWQIHLPVTAELLPGDDVALRIGA